MSIKKILPFIFFIGLALLFINTLWWRYQLSVNRYYDVDEFAHLRWASMVVSGYRPYIDFFSFFPPGFGWFLSPLFIVGTGIFPIDGARLLMFGILLFISLSAGLLFWSVRKSYLWILVSLLVVFLPIPSDKFIEIRPDSLATLLWILGIYFQILWMRNGKRMPGILTGVLFSASCVVLTKMIPLVGFAVGISLLHFFRRMQKMTSLGVGILLVIVPISLWLISLGDISLVWYSLTQLPLEANKISQTYSMSPELFFYPNDIFYGCWGWCSGLLANHFLWMLGLVIGVFRMFTPFMLAGRERVWEELLLSGSFLIQILLFVHFIPLKHTQYLIPVSVFVGFYVADGVHVLWQSVEKSTFGQVIFTTGFTVMVFGIFQLNAIVNSPKIPWTNTEMRQSIITLFERIPKDSYVLDFDGRTLYYKNPYYVCCLPWGQFASFLSRPLPSLINALEKTEAQYIFVGQLGREQSLTSEERQYLSQHYVSDTKETGLWVRKMVQ